MLGWLRRRLPRKPVRALFIGNSLTHFSIETGEGSVVLNDLPGLLARMARARRRTLVAGRVCAHGRTLEEHWESGMLDGALRPGAWDLVVLQENGARASSEQPAMKRAARLLHARIGAAGARTALFSAGACARSRAAYAELAAELDAKLIPVSEAWERSRVARPGLELNLKDGVHPGPAGVYLNACVFYACLFGEGLDSAGDDAEAVRELETAVRRAEGRGGRPPCSAADLRSLRAAARRAVQPPVARGDDVPAE